MIKQLQFFTICVSLSVTYFFSGCATEQLGQVASPDHQNQPARISKPSSSPSRSSSAGEIDILGLQRSLGMDRALEDLGYQERQFNTCSVGYGYSASSQCRSATLAVVHFRLQCRDSDGTVDTVTASQVSPVVSNKVRWTLGGQEGLTKTDGDGFGQFSAITDKPSKSSRLKFSLSGQFLVIRAEDAGRLVAPLSWCKGI